MSQIIELLYQGFDSSQNSTLSPDPTIEEDALLEGTLLGTLGVMINYSIAILFDLRTSMYMDQGNTGLLIARKVLEVSITPLPVQSFHYVWIIGSSNITDEGLYCSLNIDNRIHVKSLDIEFIVGTVDNIGAAANSLDDGLNTYLQSTPNWNSDLKVIGRSCITASKLPTS